jgi:hypothetical protein
MLLVLAGLAVGFFFRNHEIAMESYLRVAFPYDRPVSFYDPARIRLSPEYTFLENTFSPLVQFTPGGELVSAVAGEFFWQGNDAIFRIRPNLRTIDGRIINAFDVEASFKRLLILKGSSHGDLGDMLCPGLTLRTLNDYCPGMNVTESGATLVLTFAEKKLFLFPMLAAIDFAVIPKDSIDPKTLNIVDYRNTSGPYYVASEAGGGRILLAANPNHFGYTSSMPQQAELIPSGLKDPRESIKLFLDDKIDFISTVDHVPHDRMLQLAKQQSQIVTVHSTLPLRTYVANFTKKGRSRLSISERLKVGRSLRKRFLSWVQDKEGYEASEQLFSPFGEGALSQALLSSLQQSYASSESENLTSKPLLGWMIRMGDFSSKLAEINAEFPSISVIPMNRVPALEDFGTNGLEEPDFVISGPDMGFLEDIGLLSHYIGVEMFAVSQGEGRKWLNEYMAIQNKSDRLLKLRQLHFDTLKQGVTIPFAASPYTAVVRRPWRMELSRVQASDALWRIHGE